MVRKLTEKEVTFTVRCEPEDIPFVGNCSAIDAETDRAAERWIEEQLENGNEWAWCYVVVTAEWEGFVGRDSLGGCSYESRESFCQPGGYFDDMKAEALAELNRAIAKTAKRLAKLV